jgi:uncharacterized protein YydD (DUF2326 family)
MTLSRLYSNKPFVFTPINFEDGLNVVLAEIRLPENRNKDTHNLGKSTLGRLIDYAFLVGRDARFFLFRHLELFKDFIFFLEVRLADESFVTVRRGVEEATKISFKKHTERHRDFSDAPESEWDHWELPFDRARDMLDGLLDWRAVKPWGYRKGLGYLLRSQDDYRDVFQLKKFASGHADWKPFLAQTLGFQADLISSHYSKEEEKERKEQEAGIINRELGGSIQDISKVEGLLLLKKQDADKKQRLLDAFDFRAHDKNLTKDIVDEIDEQIATLNNRRYSLGQSRKKIIASLQEDQILFNPNEAQQLFGEAGVLFQGQIRKDFDQLIAFNKAITEERSVYLEEERTEIDTELKQLNSELNALGRRRSEALSFLSSTDIFNKYKGVSDELVTIRADITALERQREALHRLQELRAEIRSLADELLRLQTAIEGDVEKQNSDTSSLFSTIRIYFSEIVETVIDRKALLSVSPNKEGHLEFRADILDEAGKATSAGLGHTYKKLLCIAFDLAVLRSHLHERFPRFAYHDGVFESLDPRKRANLLGVLREYAILGLQPIITLIDADLPLSNDGNPVFDQSEIIVLLHDEGDEGRLFKMPAW